MALSNIFREPRREITESIVGIVLVGLLLGADYRFATWFEVATGGDGKGCPWPIGLIFGAGAAFFLVIAAVATHQIGDSICNALDRRGLQLRPINRPGRQS